MPVAYTLDPVLGWVPAIPEPFWYRSWRTLFRDRPACYRKDCCRMTFLDGVVPMIFETKKDYETHYVLTHLEKDIENENHTY